jgi:hypothetical protein
LGGHQNDILRKKEVADHHEIARLKAENDTLKKSLAEADQPKKKKKKKKNRHLHY